ncbi:dephospho-CoA kinase [Candidatus Thioglobus sp.]|jgi:dephospho-CoA kinase|uniref:dephospho-CoA kinase n=1 Tax=Candidatus Thioglobus sp. TaxID=2026721 RepID=UPI001D92AD95|nr:dephospho-CoA kinase [Candidatus Thioglobus sp.]MBT3277444.1 dephospho-CoA kinase [Candidatus Thioglobus sp.]MBT3446482.1 dephospho-CoA kinase [Candidatus Thioglobus sp.]MBT3745085.1 dephospho-CoA kinase [Candidatus Thioglobus sp.]MBT4181945.1 dephospho-CoA kinase [Candidatus Thioglobus sp.]MBT4421613.1 dephospho-CoA kinase [Candidatus Thioglobus sp.]
MKIALTGGIACGKSNVAQLFEQLGAEVISLDELSRQVVVPGSAGLSELVDCFGDDILTVDKTLNRKILQEILLKNKANQQLIEDILHPKILEKMQMEIENCKKQLIIIEIPLLVEKNLAYLFDRAIIVECNEENQLKRLIKREKIDKNSAKTLISAQTSHSNRLKLADQLSIDVIENNLEIFDLEQKVRNLYQKLINL